LAVRCGLRQQRDGARSRELHQPLSAIRNYARASQMQQRTDEQR
jgi:hypothetical protein